MEELLEEERILTRIFIYTSYCNQTRNLTIEAILK